MGKNKGRNSKSSKRSSTTSAGSARSSVTSVTTNDDDQTLNPTTAVPTTSSNLNSTTSSSTLIDRARDRAEETLDDFKPVVRKAKRQAKEKLEDVKRKSEDASRKMRKFAENMDGMDEYYVKETVASGGMKMMVLLLVAIGMCVVCCLCWDCLIIRGRPESFKRSTEQVLPDPIIEKA